MSAEVQKIAAAQEVLEAETVPTHTRTPEQMLLGVFADSKAGPIPGVPTDEIAPPPLAPSAEEIHQAIKTLTSLQASSGGEVSEGEQGDIFLCYDLCMRVKGEPELHIKDRRVLHRALLPAGLPSATADMEAALYAIIRPFEQHLLGIIGKQTTAPQGEVPRPKLGLANKS